MFFQLNYDSHMFWYITPYDREQLIFIMWLYWILSNDFTVFTSISLAGYTLNTKRSVWPRYFWLSISSQPKIEDSYFGGHIEIRRHFGYFRDNFSTWYYILIYLQCFDTSVYQLMWFIYKIYHYIAFPIFFLV